MFMFDTNYNNFNTFIIYIYFCKYYYVYWLQYFCSSEFGVGTFITYFCVNL